mgnify:CR=1 FL=1
MAMKYFLGAAAGIALIGLFARFHSFPLPESCQFEDASGGSGNISSYQELHQVVGEDRMQDLKEKYLLYNPPLGSLEVLDCKL